ncbi:MAG: sodium:solute symporter family protein [Vicinamibacterales bacterium]
MLDALIVLVFVGYSIGAGFRSRRVASESLEEYFLAGRTLKGWQAGMSMAATQFAADTPLLVAGLVASGGIFLLWRLWIYGLAFLAMAFIFARMWRRAGVLTDAELTEIRYSGPVVLPLRVLKAFYYGTFFNCVVLAMVLVAAVRIAEVFLPWHEWLPAGPYGALTGLVGATGLELGASPQGLAPAVATTNQLLSIGLVLGFTALYSTTGGLRAVVATDVAQFGIAMAGTAIYAVVLTWQAGGLGAVAAHTAELYGRVRAAELLSFTPPVNGATLPFLSIVALQWLFQINADGTGYLAQRAMACRSDRDARIACLVFAWAQILVRSLVWVVIAAALLVVYPLPDPTHVDVAHREMLFVVGLDEHLGPGVRGLLLVAMLAALASTIDTHLNWGASYWSNDVYGRLVCRAWLRRAPGSRELVVVARLSTLLLVVLALAVMTQLGSIQEAWQVSLLFGAGLGSVLVLRWLWERITAWSEVCAVLVSLIGAPVLLAAGADEWMQIAGMALLSTAAAVGAALLGPPTDPAVLDAFYRRVRPIGWWRQTAARVGADTDITRRATRMAFSLTATCSVSLFLMLVGAGGWMLDPPGVSPTGALMLFAAGLLIVPLWWRGATGATDGTGATD